MDTTKQQALIVIEGRATYERILSTLGGVDQEEVIRQIQNFLKVYPEFAQAHNDLAVIFYRAGNALMALAHHEKAHKLEPMNITFRKNLADFYAVELDWTDEAIHMYLDVLKDNPFDIESLTALGTINERAGRREQARQFFARAHQLDPLATDARDALQLMSGASAPDQLAAPAIALAPTVPGGAPITPAVPPPTPEEIHARALEAANGGRDQAAIDLLEQLVLQYPQYAVAHNDLGVLYQRNGDFQQARRHHQQAAAHSPANPTFHKNLAELLAVCLKEYEEAMGIYVKLLSGNPRDTEVLKGIAYICTETGKFTDARTFLEKILSIEPWNQDARQCLDNLPDREATAKTPSEEELYAEATQHVSENRLSEAAALLEELIRFYPDNALGHNDLGVVRYRLGDVEGSRRAYEEAVKLDPRNINFRKNLADLYFAETGMTDEAIRIYLDLFREQPRDIEILSALGQICGAVGRPEEAKTFFKRLLEIEPWNLQAREALNSYSA